MTFVQLTGVFGSADACSVSSHQFDCAEEKEERCLKFVLQLYAGALHYSMCGLMTRGSEVTVLSEIHGSCGGLAPLK